MLQNVLFFRSILAGFVLFAWYILVGANPAAAQSPRLPDGETTRWRGYSAWLTLPMTRYDHGVLGDAIEAGGFSVTTPAGKNLNYKLGPDAVFEDRRVRLDDLDGDGTPEAIVIKSYLARGAAIAIYRLHSGRITPLVEGPVIGRAHRWLNIIGIADFDGDGHRDIAYVQTPHLAGIVRVLSFRRGQLTETGRLAGYTNHAIGDRNLDEAKVRDVDGDGRPDIVIPVIGRKAIATLSFRNGKLREVSRVRR